MSEGDPPRYVLDASIASKWYLNDEEHVVEADALLDAFGAGRIAFIAPEHIHYEVANVLRTAVRRERLPEEEARLSLLDFLGLAIPTVHGTQLIIPAFDLAHEFGCALYDGLYLALADSAGVSLIHADRRLRNTLDGRFPGEFWIEDYDTDTG